MQQSPSRPQPPPSRASSASIAAYQDSCTSTPTSNMCFSDDDYSYESRFEVRNGRRYYAEDYHPRFGMSRRRKYGLGGSYYPSRYYVGPPRGRHISNAVIRPNSYSQSGGGYPLGVVPGGYSRSVPGRYSQTMVPRGLAGCGYPGYSSGYANGTGYHVGTRDVLAVNSAIVSCSPSLFAPIALPCAFPLPHRCLTPLSLARMTP